MRGAMKRATVRSVEYISVKRRGESVRRKRGARGGKKDEDGVGRKE